MACEDDGPFVWRDAPLAEPALAAAIARHEPPDNYLSEVQPAATFVRSLADCVDSAVLLLIDYGFPASEYYHPQRHRGTLMPLPPPQPRRPFFWPGLQDITAMCFSAIWAAADAAGWQLENYASQAGYLLDAGLLRALQALEPGPVFPAAAMAQNWSARRKWAGRFRWCL